MRNIAFLVYSVQVRNSRFKMYIGIDGDQRVIVTRYISSPLESGTVVPHVCHKRSWFTNSPAVPDLLYFSVSRRQ